MTADMTVAEVARHLGLSRQRIRQLLAAGRIRARKIGRDWVVRRADLERAEPHLHRKDSGPGRGGH